LNDSKEAMRRDWDERARHDAFFYIASWRKDWDEVSFFESGEHDYLRFVQPILHKLEVDPASKCMAELGCGAGRMTRSFARRFGSVIAVDISSEMQARAKDYLHSVSNIQWVLSDGESLAGVPTASVDFVFSYLVLQHMPKSELVRSSIREMMRILLPGGAFLFQFNGSEPYTMNWKGRTLSRLLDGLVSVGLKRASQRLASIAGIDPEMIGKTWRGAALATNDITDVLTSAQGIPKGFLDQGSPFEWCYGRKRSEERE
jgi:ubiquinone/menaquinone biosynthesis C-methylase UbiE